MATADQLGPSSLCPVCVTVSRRASKPVRISGSVSDSDRRLPRRRRVKGRQVARLRRAGATWIAAVFAGWRWCFGRDRGGGATPEVDVGRLRFRLGSLLTLELAARTACRSSPRSILPDFCPAHSPPSPLPRLPAVPITGFSPDPPLQVSAAVDSTVAIDRVKGACHVIVAPPVARVAAEHGLPDCRGRTRCPTIGTLCVSGRSHVQPCEARIFAVSGVSARLHMTTHARYWRAISSLE